MSMHGSVTDFERVNPTFGHASIGRGQKSSAFTPVRATQTPTTYVIRACHSNIIIIKVALTFAKALTGPDQRVFYKGLKHWCFRILLSVYTSVSAISMWIFFSRLFCFSFVPFCNATQCHTMPKQCVE